MLDHCSTFRTIHQTSTPLYVIRTSFRATAVLHIAESAPKQPLQSHCPCATSNLGIIKRSAQRASDVFSLLSACTKRNSIISREKIYLTLMLFFSLLVATARARARNDTLFILTRGISRFITLINRARVELFTDLHNEPVVKASLAVVSLSLLFGNDFPFRYNV